MKFLEENIEKNERQFEPEIVIQKMKKIKKAKKAKPMNYKNIEPLTNIYEEDDHLPEENSTAPLREGLRGNPRQDGVANFSDNDYVGDKDNIYEGKGGKSQTPGQKLEDLINYCYNSLRKIPLLIAYHIIQGIETADNGINKAINSRMKRTSDNPSDVINDQKVIANLISWIFCILISMYAIWNWFYIIAYKTEHKEETILPEILNRQVISRKGAFDPLFKLIDYFFNMSLFFPEKLQAGIHLGSSYVRSSFNPSFIFAFVFFTLIFLFYHSLSAIREFFVAVVRFDMNNTTLCTMYGILCFLLAISFFAPPININIESVEDAAALPGTIITQVTEIASNINPFKAILNLVIFILHFLFIIFLGVPVAAFLCIAYLFIYTFFGIFLLKWFNFYEIWNLFWEKMPAYARSEKDKIKVETDCGTLTFWQTMLNAFHYSFDIIYKYSFEIAFIYMLLFSVFDCWYKLKVKSVRMTMTMIVGIMIVALLFGCYYHFEYEQEVMLMEAVKKEKEELERLSSVVSPSNSVSSGFGLSNMFSSIASIFGMKGMPDMAALGQNNPMAALGNNPMAALGNNPMAALGNNPMAALGNNPIAALDLPKVPGSV